MSVTYFGLPTSSANSTSPISKATRSVLGLGRISPRKTRFTTPGTGARTSLSSVVRITNLTVDDASPTSSTIPVTGETATCIFSSFRKKSGAKKVARFPKEP